MAIKMVAQRRYYHKADQREYMAGEEFTVATEREAKHLGLMRRALRAEDQPAQNKPRRSRPPKVQEDPVAAVPAEPVPDPYFYQRRDLRAED